MTRSPLLTPAGAYDRAAICREAHRQFRLMRSCRLPFLTDWVLHDGLPIFEEVVRERFDRNSDA